MTPKMKKMMIALLALAFALAAVLPALAEDPAPGQAQNAETKNLRKEIVRLKYVRAQDIQNLLYAYVSRDGHVQFNPNMPSVLAVSDTPENVEKILAAIREIDVKPADVLYTVQLVLGSEADATTDAELKADPVIRELGKLLRYKGYTLLDSTLIRTVNMENGNVQFGPKADFHLALRPEVIGDAKMPVIKTQVQLRKTVVRGLVKAKPEGAETPQGQVTNHVTLIESSLNIKSGDRTVVGVSKLDGGDKGLILIISAKIVD
ncbi:MAG: secretin N-terminal domain-containing protein [Acidobacteriota bacterium]